MDDVGERASNRLTHFILRDVKRAIGDFDMIRPGDRVAVAVSGGKDSLSLLRLLQRWQQIAPIRFDLAAVHVRGDATGLTAPHAPLEEWLAAQGPPYHAVEPELSATDVVPLTCQRCTWLRRKALFLAAEALGCNVVAYAHHADDVAQTTLLNLLYTGGVHTLAPAAPYFGGRFRLIRPLLYVPEKELARYARASGFPPPPARCPRSSRSRRAVAAQMLRLIHHRELVQVRANLMRVGLEHNEQSATSNE